MMRLLAAAAATLILAPTTASALDCSYEGVTFPATQAVKLDGWPAIFKALNPGEAVPADDDAIGHDLCWDKGCQNQPELVVDANGMGHLVARAPGGGMWLVTDLDYSDQGQCSRQVFTVTRQGEDYLLITGYTEWGERVYCEEDDEDCPGAACCSAGDEYHHWLFDLKAGELLVMATCGDMQSSDSPNAVPAPKAAISDGAFRYTGCDHALNIELATVKACAAAAGRKDAKLAMKLVNDGRKQTKAKDYSGAIRTFGLAIDADAGTAQAWSGRGYARLLAGALDDAQADFERALALNKDQAYQSAIWFNLGLLAEKRNNDMAAVLAFSRAYELKPGAAVEKKLKQYQKKTATRKLEKKAPVKKGHK